MNRNPKISIIMAAYNETRQWLSKAIESILNQSYRDFEFIIILDNPKNQELKDLITEYLKKDGRIKFFINEENLGLIKSLNKGIKEAKGEYIGRMDADDICYLNRLQVQLDFLESNKDIDLVGSAVTLIGEEDEVLEEVTKVAKNTDAIKEYLKLTNVVVHPTIMFRKSILENGVENYRNIPFAEDYDFMCRVVATGHKITNIDEPLLKYRIRETSISREKFLAQLYNSFYLKNLYKVMLHTGKDIYDENDLYSEGKIDKGEIERFNKSEKLKREALKLKQDGYKLKGSIKMVRCKLLSKYALKNALCTLTYKIKFKFKEN